MTAKQLRWRTTAALYSSPATRWIPPLGRRVVGDLLDFKQGLTKGHAWFMPPRRLGYVGGGNYLWVAETFRELFVRFGGLDETTDVLDIGCGNGRMALAVLGVMGEGGRYEGFDVIPDGVDWCERTLAAHFPRAHFRTVDVKSDRYNRNGGSGPAHYRFPYEDESFDLAIATSLFTHLEPDTAANYIAETRRCLRPGGRLFGTWFLLTDDRPRADGALGDQRAWFPNEMPGGWRTVSRRIPEFSIAAPLEWVRDAHVRAGFESFEAHFGHWLGVDGPTGQDIVVATR